MDEDNDRPNEMARPNERDVPPLPETADGQILIYRDQARRHRPMHMSDWAARLDSFLQFNERNVLTHAGAISHELAEEHAPANSPYLTGSVLRPRPPNPPMISAAQSRM